MSISVGQEIARFTIKEIKLWNDGYSHQTLQLQRAEDNNFTAHVTIRQDLPGTPALVTAACRENKEHIIHPDSRTLDVISEQEISTLTEAFSKLPGFYPQTLFCILDVENTFYYHDPNDVDPRVKAILALIPEHLRTKEPDEVQITGSSTRSWTYTTMTDPRVRFVVDVQDRDWRLLRKIVKYQMAAMVPECARLPGIRIIAHYPENSWCKPHNFQEDLFPAADDWIKDPEHGSSMRYKESLIYINRLPGEITPQLVERVKEIENRAKRHFEANPGMSSKQLKWLLGKLVSQYTPKT